MYLFEEAKANKRTLFVLGKLINVLRYKRFKKKKSVVKKSKVEHFIRTIKDSLRLR